ncbi:MAG: tripartite tricarboxylate transporter substrate binding protein [Planctomycetes bacterium]|nr:tripartite tricarboxylate transporter substrate binding protein [Planctomycetota bacterium]
MLKNWLPLALVAGLLCGQTMYSAGAVEYPTKQIVITVPPAPGGGTDLLVRAMVPAVKNILGQNVVVVNKTGAGYAIGYSAGAKDAPDGYSVTALVPELLAVPHVSQVDYTWRDYDIVACVNSTYGTLSVAADAPYNTVAEFVEYAKQNPGKVRFANSGIGGNWHVLAAAFAAKAGIDVIHVPFDGGGPSAIAVAGNHVEATTCSAQEVEVQVKAGKIKILCIFAPERNPAFPDVPTGAEAGYPEPILTIFRGFGVPKGTPQEVIGILDDAFKRALDDPEVTKFMEAQHFDKDYRSGPEFTALIEREDAIYKEQVEALGLSTK